VADWAAIKTEYITGDYKDLKALAEAKGLNYGTVRKHSKGWEQERTEHRNRVGTRTEQKAVEKKSDIESDIAALKAESRRLLWEVTRDRIKGINEETEAADVRRYVQNYTDLLNSEPQDAQNNAGMGEQIDAARASWREFIEEGQNNGTE
jgi:hypothetical protein